MPASRRILILEDELLYLGLVVTACKKAGFDSISARSADEAMLLLEELQTVELEPITVDAIWLDHFLPEKNGSDFLKALHEKKEWRDIPVCLVSNAVETEITNWYIRAGVKQVFQKMMNTPPKIIADIDLYLQRLESSQP